MVAAAGEAYGKERRKTISWPRLIFRTSKAIQRQQVRGSCWMAGVVAVTVVQTKDNLACKNGDCFMVF